MEKKEAKANFNRLLPRIHKGIKYFDNTSIPMEEKEKHYQKFIEIVIEWENSIKVLKSFGVLVKLEQLLNGF